MMMDQLRPDGCRRERKRKRSRSRLRSPSISVADAESVKDICACVRLAVDAYEDQTKWLKVKIPGILIQKIEASCCSQRSGLRSSCGTGNSDSPHCHHPDDEVYPGTHCQELAKYFDKVVLQRYVKFEVDPVFNGPFTFQLPAGPSSWYAGIAPIGSTMYGLGGCADHFDPEATIQVCYESSGRDPTNSGDLPKQLVTGPPITGGKPLTSGPPNPPPIRTSVNLCYHFYYCDFSKPDPQWQISSQTLISPRFLPKLISLQGKLFAFGGNSPSDHDAPFAEVFDFDLGYWEPLPRPPFGRLSTYELFVFPLATSARILVLGTYSGIYYTFDLSTWYWRPVEAIANIESLGDLQLRHRSDALPVLSVFNEAIYWLGMFGVLCVYNFAGDGKYYEGLITGLHLEEHGRLFRDPFFCLALLPLSKHLMGLLWVSNHMSDDLTNLDCSAVLHLTILHISFLSKMDTDIEDDDAYIGPANPLTASTVACLAFPLEGNNVCQVVDAYLMGEGEGERNVF